ncbi:MAG: hypothetical protein PVF65_04910 [Sphingomonadales bacterium]|jgi:hypothetical protein
MRWLHSPLSWTLGLIVSLYFSSAIGDLAAAITFAGVFSFVFIGLQALQPLPIKMRITQPFGQMMRPRTQPDRN